MTMLRQLRRRLQMKSKIALFFMILISFLLQCTLLHVISIGSITPNLILILCISMGLMRGRKSGLWTGFFPAAVPFLSLRRQYGKISSRRRHYLPARRARRGEGLSDHR